MYAHVELGKIFSLPLWSSVALPTQDNTAVKATGKSQAIIAGTGFCALSLQEAGYGVWPNQEASGTTFAEIRD
ncbi:hypothetical protein GGS21DRAFT_494666 [Xylaria nigripes]|nr:hypothetical protein GGS21DRAFT_494666 [Xylaria nigripes]